MCVFETFPKQFTPLINSANATITLNSDYFYFLKTFSTHTKILWDFVCIHFPFFKYGFNKSLNAIEKIERQAAILLLRLPFFYFTTPIHHRNCTSWTDLLRYSSRLTTFFSLVHLVAGQIVESIGGSSWANFSASPQFRFPCIQHSDPL